MSGWLAGICTIAINGITILSIMLLIQLFFDARPCLKWQQYLILTAGVVLYNGIILLFFPENEVGQFVSLFILLVIFGVMTAQKSRIRTGLEAVLACMLYGWYEFLVQMLEELLQLDRYSFLLQGENQSFFDIGMCVALLAGLFIVICKGKHKNICLRLTVGEEVILGILSFLSPIFSIGLTYINENLGRGIYSIAWVAFVLILNIGSFVGIINRKLVRHYRAVSENYRQSFHTEYQYFRDYKEKQSDLVKFRHDFKNHMLTVQGLLEQGEYEKAQDYFRRISAQSGISEGGILSGNEIADILLNAKAEWMEQNEIEFELQGNLQALSMLEMPDCSILFSNLIDNAIEANLNYVGNRYIRIQAAEQPGILLLSVENPIAGDLKRNGNSLQSSKNDADRHGIGSQNIRAVIEKYHGEYQIQVKENQFRVQMLIPLHQ